MGQRGPVGPKGEKVSLHDEYYISLNTNPDGNIFYLVFNNVII